jgi:hypothetical protein
MYVSASSNRWPEALAKSTTAYGRKRSFRDGRDAFLSLDHCQVSLLPLDFLGR